MITSKRDIWRAMAAVTGIGWTVVTIAILLAYPPEDWAFELALSLSLTAAISIPCVYFIAFQTLKAHLLSLELERLVNRDRLTDVATRDYFFNRMAEQPDAFGVSLMIDIDHFKAINDTYGHLAGDEVIRKVAATIRDQCRADDIVCRFGGEEFIVFLGQADHDLGQRFAERIRAAVANRTVSFDNQPISVTISVGGSLKSATEDISEAIKAADEALYKAKERGRNRTVLTWLDEKRRSLGIVY